MCFQVFVVRSPYPLILAAFLSETNAFQCAGISLDGGESKHPGSRVLGPCMVNTSSSALGPLEASPLKLREF